MPHLQVIFASTSGHTEYVVRTLADALKTNAPEWTVDLKRAEESSADDLLKGDALLLASSTWNTGGAEGQLNPHMYLFLNNKAKDIDLKGKKVALIALGDHRYFYQAGAAGHLEEFVSKHGGAMLLPTLKIINEPYGQEKDVLDWSKKLAASLSLKA